MIEKLLQGLGEVLKGLVQFTIRKIKVDMFKKTGDTYNIDKIEIKIDVHISTPTPLEVNMETTITDQSDDQTPEQN